MFYTYIIYSDRIDKYYIRSCRGELKDRLEKHNTGYYGGKSFTSQTDDWILILKFECNDFSHAIRLERKIKSMKSKVYIRNLIKYPELRAKILSETRN